MVLKKEATEIDSIENMRKSMEGGGRGQSEQKIWGRCEHSEDFPAIWILYGNDALSCVSVEEGPELTAPLHLSAWDTAVDGRQIICCQHSKFQHIKWNVTYVAHFYLFPFLVLVSVLNGLSNTELLSNGKTRSGLCCLISDKKDINCVGFLQQPN